MDIIDIIKNSTDIVFMHIDLSDSKKIMCIGYNGTEETFRKKLKEWLKKEVKKVDDG